MKINKASRRDRVRRKARHAPTRERWLTHVQNGWNKHNGGKNA